MLHPRSLGLLRINSFTDIFQRLCVDLTNLLLFLKIPRLPIFQNNFWLLQIYHERRFICGCRMNIWEIIYSSRLQKGKISSHRKQFSSKDFAVGKQILHLQTCARIGWEQCLSKTFFIAIYSGLVKFLFLEEFQHQWFINYTHKKLCKCQSWNICISNI